MTFTGKVFTEIATKAIKKGGHGTTKMVPRCADKAADEMKEIYRADPATYAEALQAMMDGHRTEEEAREMVERNLWMVGCRAIEKAHADEYAAINYLVTEGYLKAWDQKITETKSKMWVGLTPKGWEVAHKYLNGGK